jgi:drug/metabolite transporter (DMT)-like permease
MRLSPQLRVKTYVLIALMVLFGALGDILLSKGMREIGRVSFSSAHLVSSAAVETFTSRLIWLGIACLLAFFICYVVVLSWADYSFVSPASATSYAVVALLGWIVLGEVVSDVRWAGILVISVGVLLVSHTPPRTTEQG